MLKYLIFIATILVVTASNYDGYKVFTVTLTKDQLPLLDQLKSQVRIDTWREPTVTPENLKKSAKFNPTYKTDLMVNPRDSTFVENFSKVHGLDCMVKLENVGSLIREQREASQLYQKERKLKGQEVMTIDWNDYYPTQAIYDWIDEIVANNSDIATIQVLGQSLEGREVKMVKISSGSSSNKTAVLIDGAFHAREWISPAIVTYIINEMLTQREVNREVLEAVDLYIIPLVNIDGYEYSHVSDRMWRKTRSNYNDTEDGCMGVDPNRNFDFHFGEEGTSDDKCSEIYKGPHAFSEPETAILRDVMLDTTKNWGAYLTIHSYSQLWLTPWSYTLDLPEDYDDLMTFAHIGADALTSVHGTVYTVGATTEIGGMTAGCSDDYAKGVGGIKYANTIEARDKGEYGFLLPRDQIQDTAQETWAGIQAVCLHLGQL